MKECSQDDAEIVLSFKWTHVECVYVHRYIQFFKNLHLLLNAFSFKYKLMRTIQ